MLYFSHVSSPQVQTTIICSIHVNYDDASVNVINCPREKSDISCLHFKMIELFLCRRVYKVLILVHLVLVRHHI